MRLAVTLVVLLNAVAVRNAAQLYQRLARGSVVTVSFAPVEEEVAVTNETE